MCTSNSSLSRRFFDNGSGCPVSVGNTTCGESNSLEITKEFKRLYEERLQQIDAEAGGDCSQEKIKLQQEWIRNLTQQNEMLVKAVQELEYEATDRVQQLEEKLERSAQCLCEGERLLNEKERTVQELQQKINYYNSVGDVECMAKELKCRREECESLKQAMVDMRQVLTEEVASKHDQVLLMKKNIQELEERCMQADKQTAFKDDITKELRKEIKQLRQQVSIPEKPAKASFTNPIHKITQTSPIKEKPRCQENPYLIINHSSKKQVGKNTVIYITKDGSVHKEVNYAITQNSLEKNFGEHTDTCSKCKNKLIKQTKSFFPACKSENDLANVMNMLKPVKERSKLTNTALSRCNTFVDRTKYSLNVTELGETLCEKRVSIPNHVPVKMHINNLERKIY